MQNQMPADRNRKRLGPPPVELTQGTEHTFKRQTPPRRGLSKGEIAVGLGIAFGFIFLGVIYNLIR